MTVTEVFPEDMIYSKNINNANLGSEKKHFKLKFIKTKDFFAKLKEIGIRKSNNSH
jgi:hypothetical protein